MEEFLRKIKKNFKVGEPIFTNEILALFNYEKQKTMWLLKKSIDNGDIKKIERGTYFIPKYEKGELYGYKYETDNAPLKDDVATKKYLYNKKGEVYGIYNKIGLENLLHITTQMPYRYADYIITNKTSKSKRVVEVMGEITELKKPYIKITKDNYKEYQVLQVINLIDLKRMKWEHKKIKDYIEHYKIDKEKLRKMILSFPKRVQLRAEYYHIL